jgi:hypothetical protein
MVILNSKIKDKLMFEREENIYSHTIFIHIFKKIKKKKINKITIYTVICAKYSNYIYIHIFLLSGQDICKQVRNLKKSIEQNFCETFTFYKY